MLVGSRWRVYPWSHYLHNLAWLQCLASGYSDRRVILLSLLEVLVLGRWFPLATELEPLLAVLHDSWRANHASWIHFLPIHFLCSVLFWISLFDYDSMCTCIVESTLGFSNSASGYTCKYPQGFPLVAGNENGGYGLLGARVSCVASGHLDGFAVYESLK